MRRRLSMMLLALIALAAVPALAGATHSSGEGDRPDRDMVNGGGQLPAPPGIPTNNFSHNAKGDLFDADGRIHFHERGGEFKINGDVLCVRAEGNRASILYEDAAGTRPARTTAGGVIYVEDNGQPLGGQPVDRENNNRLTRQQLDQQLGNGCPDPSNAVTYPLRNGNLTVHDGV
jgi:hypothetical protein